MSARNEAERKKAILQEEMLALEREKAILADLEFRLQLRQEMLEREEQRKEKREQEEIEQREQRARAAEKNRKRLEEIERIDALSRQERPQSQNSARLPQLSSEEMRQQTELRRIEADRKFKLIIQEKRTREQQRTEKLNREIQSARISGRKSSSLSSQSEPITFQHRNLRKIPHLVTTANDDIDW